jgi:hypothetical protein
MTTGNGIAIAGIWIAWAIYCQAAEVQGWGVWIFFLLACLGTWIFK